MAKVTVGHLSYYTFYFTLHSEIFLLHFSSIPYTKPLFSSPNRVDKGGLAEANGIRVGDQITNVNGTNFEQITHGMAVEHIKNQRHLIMTIRSVNRYPAYKEKTGDEEKKELREERKEHRDGRKENREMKAKEKISSKSSVFFPKNLMIFDLNMLNSSVMFIWKIEYFRLFLTYLQNEYQKKKYKQTKT